MIDFVHKYKRLILVAVLVLIIPPFALFGIDSYFQGIDRSAGVAKIGSQDISQQAFNQALRERQDTIQRMTGGKAPPELLDNPELRFAVLDELIRQRLLLGRALDVGMTIGDQQLQSVIGELPMLQDAGKFSFERYEQFLRSQGMTSAVFESRLRQDLLQQHMVNAYVGSGFMPRTVTERLVRISEQQREVSQFTVTPDKFFAQVKLDAGAAKKYYDAHQDEFRIPEQLRVEYVVLSVDSLLSQMQADADEVRKYYDGHLDQYGTQEERQASHILISADTAAGAEAKQQARAKADDLYKQLKQKPAAFADLAKQHSQDPGSAAKGGDLGYFGRGAMVKDFEDAVFKLKVGEISAPVESQYGFHIIRLDAIKPSQMRSFDEVRGQIETELKKQQAGRKFAAISENFNNAVFEQSESLKAAAELANSSVQQSGWIGRDHAADTRLNHPKLLQAIFSEEVLTNKRNSEVVEVAPGVLVAARLLERKAASVQPFKDISETIVKKLTLQQASQLAVQEGRAILERLKQGKDTQVTWATPILASRADPKGLNVTFLNQVFKVDTGKLPAFAGVENPQGGFALLRISRVVEPENTAADLKKSLADSLTKVVSDEVMAAYVASLKQKADVKISRDQLEKK
jgi:peptidyl-prolyl cis-trans isomerase D